MSLSFDLSSFLHTMPECITSKLAHRRFQLTLYCALLRATEDTFAQSEALDLLAKNDLPLSCYVTITM
jgi:hypothetical protein